MRGGGGDDGEGDDDQTGLQVNQVNAFGQSCITEMEENSKFCDKQMETLSLLFPPDETVVPFNDSATAVIDEDYDDTLPNQHPCKNIRLLRFEPHPHKVKSSIENVKNASLPD